MRYVCVCWRSRATEGGVSWFIVLISKTLSRVLLLKGTEFITSKSTARAPEGVAGGLTVPS